jgi:hypothetical protein
MWKVCKAACAVTLVDTPYTDIIMMILSYSIVFLINATSCPSFSQATFMLATSSFRKIKFSTDFTMKRTNNKFAKI